MVLNTFKSTSLFVFLSLLSQNAAFQAVDVASKVHQLNSITTTQLSMDRRNFGAAIVAGAFTAAATSTPASAKVFFDPAMYGDQELRLATVYSLREAVRRSILQKPELAPSFYQLALLDGLSYKQSTDEFGPDGNMLRAILSADATDDYTKNLQEASLCLINAAKVLKAKTAITVADAIAVGGSEAIESIGGPSLTVQLGRADAPANSKTGQIPIDLFKGERSAKEVSAAFKSAGLTEREMTALLAGLMTIQKVEKNRTTEDWKQSSKQKFRERGKIGRMSEYRPLTEEDIARAEEEEDPDYEDPDDGMYIADSFGTKDERFGQRLGKQDINEKSFNKYVKELDALSKKKGGADLSDFGWIGELLVDKDSPTTQAWITKYAVSTLNFNKDLGIAFNSATQLGAVYTGGKYENLLKNKPRKKIGRAHV